MKIGICGDVHYCTNSSLISGKGFTYSKRIENCIRSINWFEQITSACDINIYLGDFFDKSTLSAEEITALQEIGWNKVPKYFLVGNHEMGQSDLSTSSTKVFENIHNCKIVDSPCSLFNNTVGFLPYVVDSDRKPLIEYFDNNALPDYIFSHNDIKGIQMGNFISQSGFDISEIKCKMFFNGHIHNGSKISDNVVNVGNLTGQNFSEDASKYSHKVYILDTSTNTIEEHLNPFAYNFLKIKCNDLTTVDFSCYDNIVISITCDEQYVETIKTQLMNIPNIVASRVNVISNVLSTSDIDMNKKELQVDHIKQFREYMLVNVGDTDIVKNELEEILK